MINKTELIRMKCSITSEEIEKNSVRENMNPQQKQILQMLAAQMMQKEEVHIYYKLIEKVDGNYFLVAMTLGEHVDDWIEGFLNRQELSQAYLADRLAGMVLMHAYDSFRQMVQAKQECGLGQFHFIGDRGGDEPISKVLALLEQDEIRVNEGETMIPQKTVLFEVCMTPDAAQQDMHICSTCENKNCPFAQR